MLLLPQWEQCRHPMDTNLLTPGATPAPATAWTWILHFLSQELLSEPATVGSAGSAPAANPGRLPGQTPACRGAAANPGTLQDAEGLGLHQSTNLYRGDKSDFPWSIIFSPSP